MDALANMANKARASHVRMDLVGKGMHYSVFLSYVDFSLDFVSVFVVSFVYSYAPNYSSAYVVSMLS